MGCFSESTIIGYCSNSWKHMLQRNCCVISMMDPPEETLWATLHPTKSCRLVFIGPHYSNMLTRIPESAWFVRSVSFKDRSQSPRCSLSLWKNHFNCEVYMSSVRVFHTHQRNMLHSHYHRLLHMVDISCSNKKSQ